jgi:hypothetical protein
MTKTNDVDWVALLGPGHPALKPNGKLKKKAKEILFAEPLPSRIDSVPDLDSLEAESPVRNTELFLRIADHIEMFPETYNQEVWGDVVEDANEELKETPCGTAFCIAGHAGHESGWGPGSTYVWDAWELKKVLAPTWDLLRMGDRHELSAPVVGRYELGLTAREAGVLFDENWSPYEDITVPEALRALAYGERVDVVSEAGYDDDDPYDLDSEYARRGHVPITGVPVPRP